MTAFSDVTRENSTSAHWRIRPSYPIGLLLLWLFAVSLRFWGLERFNTLVFDEIYYVKFADQYLTGTPFFDGHPPLSKYIIAVGIWVAELPHDLELSLDGGVDRIADPDRRGRTGTPN
jgi:dolichyl-phosphate-mannose--protein O-mannosyl transferase